MRYSVLFKARAHGLVSARSLSALQGAISGADTVIQWMLFKSRKDKLTRNSAAFKFGRFKRTRAGDQSYLFPGAYEVLQSSCYSRTIAPGDQPDRRRASAASIVSDGMAPHGSRTTLPCIWKQMAFIPMTCDDPRPGRCRKY